MLRVYDLDFVCCLLILLYTSEIRADPVPVPEDSYLLPRSASIRHRNPSIRSESSSENEPKIDPGFDDNSGGNKFYAEESLVAEGQPPCGFREHTTTSGTGRLAPSFRSIFPISFLNYRRRVNN
nr:uncharacterized protein LOC108128045 [Drosophila bipectinata]